VLPRSEEITASSPYVVSSTPPGASKATRDG
jgi:hypothetical protein